MRFGVSVATDIGNSHLGTYAESLGFDSFWGTDSQMIWSDVYSYLALVATKTSRITIGPLVAVAPIRLAPVTAHSIATINRLAPGRTALTLGTAFTAMNTMGMKAMPVAAFSDYLRVVRALLRGEEVEYELNGQQHPIRFLHRDLGFIRLTPTIPVIVSGLGPRTQRLAGQFGDGLIAAGFGSNGESIRANVADGAKQASRDISGEFSYFHMGSVAVLQPGEGIDSDFVIDAVGPMSLAMLHGAWENYNLDPENFVPPPMIEPFWDKYLANVESRGEPKKSRYIDVHEGHGTYVRAEERPLLTKELIRTASIVGEADEVLEHIRQLDEAGVTDFILRTGYSNAQESMRRFATLVMDRY
jgi:5,10-methylenetetrahydromethanopterin reductase